MPRRPRERQGRSAGPQAREGVGCGILVPRRKRGPRLAKYPDWRRRGRPAAPADPRRQCPALPTASLRAFTERVSGARFRGYRGGPRGQPTIPCFLILQRLENETSRRPAVADADVSLACMCDNDNQTASEQAFLSCLEGLENHASEDVSLACMCDNDSQTASEEGFESQRSVRTARERSVCQHDKKARIHDLVLANCQTKKSLMLANRFALEQGFESERSVRTACHLFWAAEEYALSPCVAVSLMLFRLI